MVKLKIISCESKSGATGNFVRCNTDQGWLSAFEEPTKTLILQSVGKDLDVEITEKQSGDKTYRNIISAKLSDGSSNNDSSSSGNVESPQETKVSNKDTSFYTAYAKDIFVALINKVEMVKGETAPAMNQAIDLVKQARKAFE